MKSSWNWQNLKFFLALARFDTLGRAAEKINSNPTTVFRRIKAFEAEVGSKLFDSTPQGYSLTPAGETLFERSEGLEEKLDTLFSSVEGMDQEIRGSVLLTTTDSLALTVLPPILKTFQGRFPAVRLRVRISPRFFNLSKREADIALRPGSQAPAHLFGKKLGKIHFALYAAQSYLERHPVKNLPAEVARHAFIGLDDSLSHLPSKQWLDRMVGDVASFTRTDNMMTAGLLCNEGLGVAILPTYFQRYCRNLVKVFQPEEFLGSDFWLLTHRDTKDIARIKATTRFLAEEIVQTIGPFLGRTSP